MSTTLLQRAEDICRKLPKTDLHVHLDGSVRPKTILALADELMPHKGYGLETVTQKMRVPDDCRSLEDYFKPFVFVNRFLQKPEALAQAARELVEDAAAENVRYIEVRFCPSIHAVGGRSLDAIVEGALDGLKAGSEKTGTRANLIICALREQTPSASMLLAEVAINYRGQGVVAFDLAGDESKKAEPHYAAFARAGEAGIARIAHAGEAAGPENIREAIDKLGAERIGHGTHLMGDLALLNEITERGIPLEVCLTSNVHTRAVANYDGHPMARYLRSGLKITINTDNRTVSNTSSTQEYARAFMHGELTRDELRRIVLAGVDAAFLPAEDKATLKQEFGAEFDRIIAEATAA